MIRNGKDISTGTVLSTQVCIIGSGPAGITAAWYLQKAGIKVILIEGSRDNGPNLEDSWSDKVLLYDGETDGLLKQNEHDFLILPYGPRQPFWERERMYGGTSMHWGGQCRPHDPIDFEKRQGFPGWPITRDDLDPYYREASALCMLHGDYHDHGDNFSTKYWAEILQAQIPVLDGFDVEMYQFVGDEYKRFATRTFEGGMTIGESPVDVILNASLLDIDHQQGSVSSLRVASMNDDSRPQKATEFTIKADAYVLACGSVANARQLLLSKAGNEHDLVGRYFMCHPLSGSTVILTTKSFLNNDQRRLMIGHTPDDVRWQDENGVWPEGRFIPNAEAAKKLGIGRCWFGPDGGACYFEMTPNPKSRVTLADTCDKVFDQKQTKINWELTDADEQTYEKSAELFKEAVNNLDGDIDITPWKYVQNQLVINGHHIGTTRMSDKPEEGVVDSNLKVHSLDNLYVAGASVFPTAAISNPTFTIITLSIRLADHLSKALNNGG